MKNLKAQIVTELRNSNCDQTKKTQIVTMQKIVTKLKKTSNFNKTKNNQKRKEKKFEKLKTQIVIKLKKNPMMTKLFFLQYLKLKW